MADAILIGGPNGAGKTTFARQLLHVRHPGSVFLNADEIQRERSGFGHPVAAARELLRRIQRAEHGDVTFAIETTLSSATYARKIPVWTARGFRTSLHFIELPSEDYAVQRVARRVAAGGHAIAEEDIRRRFRRGLELFPALYQPLPDRWYHWKSDDGGLRLVDQGQNRR